MNKKIFIQKLILLIEKWGQLDNNYNLRVDINTKSVIFVTSPGNTVNVDLICSANNSNPQIIALYSYELAAAVQMARLKLIINRRVEKY